MSFQEIEFKEFVTLQRGFDLPKTQMKDGEVPVLGSNCVIGYHNEAKVEPPGVVTGRSGTLGAVQYIDEPYWPHNTSLWVKDFKDNLPSYVYYKLQTLQLERFNGGASVPTLNRNVLDTLKIKVPDLPTQERIAEVLSAYDDLIENNRRRIRLLEESARLLYREWFVHFRFPGHEHTPRTPSGLPEGWEEAKLKTICKDIRDSVKPSDVPSDTPYIGLEHIPRRSITLSEWETAEKISSNKYLFKENDILFGKIRPYFHKVGFAMTDGITSSDAIVIRANESYLFPYLLSLVSSDAFVALASQTVKEGSKMPRADWKYLQSYLFPIPPNRLLEMYNEFFLDIMDQLKTLSLQNQKLAAARDILLPRLMNGEVAV